MKVVVVGLPYFAEILARKLSTFDPENSYSSYDTYYSKADKLKFFFAVLNADVVVSLKGVAEDSKALEWVKFLKKPVLMGWMGSDVLGAQKLFEAGNMNYSLLNYAHHFTITSWLQEELNELDIKTEILHFQTVPRSTELNQPTKAGVVAYIGANEEFYGLNELILLAKKNESIPFHVYGNDVKVDKCPRNLTIHGRVSDAKLQELLNENAIAYRYTKHDGNSQSIIEALVNGNIPMWNYPMEGCVLIENDLDKALNEALQVLKKGENREVIQNKYLDFYDSATIYRIFVDKLMSVGNK